MIIMRGLPASGKSTKAEEIVKNGRTFRVNRDKLREMLHFNNWTPKNEGLTVDIAMGVAEKILRSGYDVIIDDTNLTEGHIEKWARIANDYGAEVEIIDMTDTVSVEMCIARDKERTNSVGRHVIMDMAMRNGIVRLGNVVVCDIDGTVADPTHRLKYARGEEKNWDTFFSLMHLDTPRKEVYDMVLKEMNEHSAYLVFVSARPEKYRKQTEDWLEAQGFNDHVHLLMRRNHDKRDDTLVKSDIHRDFLSDCNIVKVFDDRPKVIRMWREKGLKVEDVGSGIEF